MTWQKKSNSQTATVQTKIDHHVVNYKNDFDKYEALFGKGFA